MMPVVASLLLLVGCTIPMSKQITATPARGQTPAQVEADTARCDEATAQAPRRAIGFAACMVDAGYATVVGLSVRASAGPFAYRHVVSMVVTAGAGAPRGDAAGDLVECAQQAARLAENESALQALAVSFGNYAAGPLVDFHVKRFGECLTPRGYRVERWEAPPFQGPPGR